ncbi:hypothetical protein [Halobacillus sp. Marseille-P3879]|uniref:hypothetical protein n=1 Tax=Halobacillus TaxID=45667 RepID=UPI000C7D7174|nr:hypothetical protein [Halobacillus sp. Marseille-P3879]
MNKENENRDGYSTQEIEKKLKEEKKRPEDPVPDKDMKKEEREIRKGHQSKNDSSTEEKFDEDLKNKEDKD